MATAGDPGRFIERMNSLSGVGVSDDRLVRVVVDGSGTPQSVTIEPDAMRLSSQVLSASVLTAITVALDDVQSQVTALVQAEAPIQDTGLGTAPGSAAEAVWRLSSQTDQAWSDFDAVRRHLLDRLPD